MRNIFFCLCILLLPLSAMAENIETLNQAQLEAMLKKNQGKVIMLNFFATWCPPCRIEIPEIVKLRNSFPDSKLMILGLSVDEDKKAVPPFTQKNGVNYPVYMATKDITDSFDISSVPHNTFFAPNGKMVISEPGMAEFDVLKHVVDDLYKR